MNQHHCRKNGALMELLFAVQHVISGRLFAVFVLYWENVTYCTHMEGNKRCLIVSQIIHG